MLFELIYWVNILRLYIELSNMWILNSIFINILERVFIEDTLRVY